MDELEKWMGRNKKLCVMTGIFGLLVSPFLWPFFVAIIFQSLSLAVPIILAWLFIKQPWIEKEEKDEEIYKGRHRAENSDTGKMPSDGTQADDIPEGRTEKGQEPVSGQERTRETPDEADCLALFWYQNEGRERISRIREKLDREGKNEFSVNKDGICTARHGNGFRRVGILRGYPGKQILSAQPELRKDGFLVRQGGDYVWISWKKGGIKHAL